MLDGRRAKHPLRPGTISKRGCAERTELDQRGGDERTAGTTLPVDGDDLVRHRDPSKSAMIRNDSVQNTLKRRIPREGFQNLQQAVPAEPKPTPPTQTTTPRSPGASIVTPPTERIGTVPSVVQVAVPRSHVGRLLFDTVVRDLQCVPGPYLFTVFHGAVR